MTDNNWGIIGNQKVVQYLQTALKNNRLSHAYLFLGKEHVGKRAIVDALVRELLATSDIFRNQLEQGIHPDVMIVQREEDKKNISVEQIRELQSMLSMSSFCNSYKIAIIEDADSLSEGASNALLKSLEEPAKQTILILIAHQGSRVLPTIYSRCQVLSCVPVADSEIERFLEEKGIPASKCSDCLSYAQGRPGQALRLAQEEELLAAHKKEEQAFTQLRTSSIAERFKILETYFGKDKKCTGNVYEILDSWMLAARMQLLDSVSDVAARGTLRQSIEAIAQAKKLLASNVNQKLVLEHLVLQFQ